MTVDSQSYEMTRFGEVKGYSSSSKIRSQHSLFSEVCSIEQYCNLKLLDIITLKFYILKCKNSPSVNLEQKETIINISTKLRINPSTHVNVLLILFYNMI